MKWASVRPYVRPAANVAISLAWSGVTIAAAPTPLALPVAGARLVSEVIKNEGVMREHRAERAADSATAPSARSDWVHSALNVGVEAAWTAVDSALGGVLGPARAAISTALTSAGDTASSAIIEAGGVRQEAEREQQAEQQRELAAAPDNVADGISAAAVAELEGQINEATVDELATFAGLSPEERQSEIAATEAGAHRDTLHAIDVLESRAAAHMADDPAAGAPTAPDPAAAPEPPTPIAPAPEPAAAAEPTPEAPVTLTPASEPTASATPAPAEPAHAPEPTAAAAPPHAPAPGLAHAPAATPAPEPSHAPEPTPAPATAPLHAPEPTPAPAATPAPEPTAAAAPAPAPEATPAPEPEPA